MGHWVYVEDAWEKKNRPEPSQRLFNIANYMILYEEKHARIVNNLRLQKLLYFVQALSFQNNGEPCFEDDIVAWDFGPVVPSIYYKYTIHGCSPIYSWCLSNRTLTEIELPEEVKDFIKDVCEICAGYYTSTLVDISRSQTPWHRTYYRRGLDRIIPNSYMKDFFYKKADKI